MKVRIETSQTDGVISGREMNSGDYGIIVEDNTDADRPRCVGHHVYRNNGQERIVDLSEPVMSWPCGDTIKVRLLARGKSITITRTE